MTLHQTIYQAPQSQPNLFPLPSSNQVRQESLTMRSSLGKNFKITERDIEILVKLAKTKYMDTLQIQKLFWRESRGGQFGAKKACQRRLRQLVAHGMIRRILQAVKRTEGSKPDLFTLDKNSIPLL